jgi:V/A-type H+-transporting ATPase subunit A
MYERAGIVRRRDGVEGSLTLIGTVSPAGGNLDDPVTRATLSSVKAFLGLTAERAYRRCYPAVDPHLSWSRYGEQLRSWYEREIGAQWHPTIERCRRRLREAQQISQLIQVAGEDAVSIDDLVRWQQGELFDAVYLQQNAFDPVDASSDLPRQWSLLRLLDEVGDTRLAFPDRDAVLDFFSGLTALFHNLNGCRDDSEDFAAYSQRIRESLAKADSRRP